MSDGLSMRRRQNRLRLGAVAMFALALAGEPMTATAASQTVVGGPALYARYCANCHGRFEKTLLPNRSASRIRSAIRLFPAMYELKDMTDAEVAVIAAALAGPEAVR